MEEQKSAVQTGLIQPVKYFIGENEWIMSDYDREYTLKVKDRPTEKKPREKLINFGPGALSVAELIAVLFGVGTRKEEVMIMSSRILKEYGDKNVVNQTDPKVMSKELDIPIAKACQLTACFELGRRYFEKNSTKNVTIRTAKQAFEYLKDMRELPKEHLRGLYLNSHYRLIHDEVISVGSLTANIVHPREVFRPAIECSAAAIIVAHNHPSGSIKPTKSDIEITEQLFEAGKILGIDLLDHIVIAKNRFLSIK